MLSFSKKNINENKKNDIKFKLPIEYLENKYKLNNDIKNDLELLDISNQSLYNNIVSSNNIKSTKLINNWCEYYTTDKDFLQEHQSLLKNYKATNTSDIDNTITNVEKLIKEVENETGFYEKYKYIDIDLLKNFNKSASVLQILTLYNLTSPVLSIAIPIIMLIIPFFIIKID